MSLPRFPSAFTARELGVPGSPHGSTPPTLRNQDGTSSDPSTPFHSRLTPRKNSLTPTEESALATADSRAPRKPSIGSSHSAFSSFKAQMPKVVSCEGAEMKTPVPIKLAHPFMLNRGYLMVQPRDQPDSPHEERENRVFKIPIPPDRAFTQSGLAKPTPQERREKIRKYKEKKARALQRGRQVRYVCRQQLAHERVRYQGRFVRPEQFAELKAAEEEERERVLEQQRSQPIFNINRDTSRREQLKEERRFLQQLQSENTSIMDDLSILGSMTSRPRESSFAASSTMSAGFGENPGFLEEAGGGGAGMFAMGCEFEEAACILERGDDQEASPEPPFVGDVQMKGLEYQ